MSQLLLAAASYVVSIVNSYPLSVSLAVVALVFRRQIRIFAELAHMYQMGRVSGSAADATVSAQTRTKPGDVGECSGGRSLSAVSLCDCFDSPFDPCFIVSPTSVLTAQCLLCLTQLRHRSTSLV